MSTTDTPLQTKKAPEADGDHIHVEVSPNGAVGGDGGFRHAAERGQAATDK